MAITSLVTNASVLPVVEQFSQLAIKDLSKKIDDVKKQALPSEQRASNSSSQPSFSSLSAVPLPSLSDRAQKNKKEVLVVTIPLSPSNFGISVSKKELEKMPEFQLADVETDEKEVEVREKFITTPRTLKEQGILMENTGTIDSNYMLPESCYNILERMKSESSPGEISINDNLNLSDCLGICYPCKVSWATKDLVLDFPSADAAFNAMKFFPHQIGLVWECRNSTTHAYKISKTYEKNIRKDWGCVKDSILKKVLFAKFIQNLGFLRLLQETQNYKLVRKSNYNEEQRDKIALILMQIRDEGLKSILK
jgi:predicted NAD-dependent protein-ADP-ribosyltransferase YbiA (DUF1768 family)